MHNCNLCGSCFSLRTLGTLQCAFHPFHYINTGVRTRPYTALDPRPSHCDTCNDAHLSGHVERRCHIHARRPSRHSVGNHLSRAGKLPAIGARQYGPAHWLRGCHRVDHSNSVSDLLTQPYFAVPLKHFHELSLGRAGAEFDPASRTVIHVHRAAQLKKTLVIQLPATGRPYVRSLLEVYREMASVFELPSLDDSLYEALIANPETSKSALKTLAHPQANRRARLRQRTPVRASRVSYQEVSL